VLLVADLARFANLLASARLQIFWTNLWRHLTLTYIRQDEPVELSQWLYDDSTINIVFDYYYYYYYYTCPSTPSCRDSEAQSTRRRRHLVVDLTVLTPCRRLRHLTDDAVLTRTVAPTTNVLPARLLLTAGWLAAGLRCIYFNSLPFLLCSFPSQDNYLQ